MGMDTEGEMPPALLDKSRVLLSVTASISQTTIHSCMNRQHFTDNYPELHEPLAFYPELHACPPTSAEPSLPINAFHHYSTEN